MSKIDKRKVWACVVVGLLTVIAVATVDVALILREGIEVEYVEQNN
jgi:hypothetical protein